MGPIDFMASLPFDWILTALFGAVVYYLAAFYWRVLRYPRGPLPLPVVGNILVLRGTTEYMADIFAGFHKKYGPVYTFWLGNDPVVFVSDLDLIREAFNAKNNEFLGRPKNFLRKIFTKRKIPYQDVVLSDHGPAWSSLRKVAHAAARKFAAADQLAYLTCDVVDQVAGTMKKNEGIDKPFDPVDYIYGIFLNVLASAAFGKRYSFDDEEYKLIKMHFESFRKGTEALPVTDTIPITRFIPYYRRMADRVVGDILFLVNKARSKYMEHVKDYEEGQMRDFGDSLIQAKEEAIAEGKETAPHLIDDNLGRVLFNLFFAGTDTTQYTMRWILLFMCKHPALQRQMRQEVEAAVGDRMPVVGDKDNCHLVNAFICECLRYRVVAPIGVPHRAVVDGTIGEHHIPKDTMIFGFNSLVMHDKRYWDSPEVFDPKRFLDPDSGHFTSRKLPAFVPFGIGRRVCLGERLALADLFLATTRLLQATSGLSFAFPRGQDQFDDKPDPNLIFISAPKKYNVVFKRE